jgi:hypothetical protein
MSLLRYSFIVLFALMPLQTMADVSAGDLPGDTVWYLHADLDQLRNAESGKAIANWIDVEVGEELRDEIGIDLNSEIDSITAYSDTTNGTVILVNGPITKKSQDKLLALATLEGDLDTRKHAGKTYYFAGGEEQDDGDDNDPFDELEDSTYFTFDVANKAIITSNENQLKALLDNNGRIVGGDSHSGALFVLSADVNFVQAGLRTDGLVDTDDEDGWESNIIKNTEQAGVLIADRDGMIAVEAKLRSKDPGMASSIGGIVNGLISLQAFNSELGPEIQSLIRNTKVEVDENVLSINTVIAPELLVKVLSD